MKLTKSSRHKLIQNKIWLVWQVNDFVRTKGIRYLSYAKLMQYVFVKYILNRINLAYLFAAHRYYQTNFISKYVCKEMRLVSDRIDRFVDILQADHFDRAARRSIILKNPDIKNTHVEKGVLLITFTETFPFFYNHIDCDQLLKYFYLVLEPSWAGYCDPNILFWTRYKSNPIAVQSTEMKDFLFLQELRSNLVPVSFGASDWVDFRIFKPLPRIKKEYDAIYVTNYNPIKRHHLLFKAIKEMQDPSYRAVLVFGRNGDAKSEINHLIDYFNVRDNLVIYESLPQKEVNELLNLSKVNLLLSTKEGSNRSIFEGFFANVPGIVLKRNIGVNKNYLNEMTGRLIEERELMQVLLYFKTNWLKYHPREWALDNISPVVTTEKLSQCLQSIAKEKGDPWTRGIVPKVNAPEVQHLHSSDEHSMITSERLLSLFLKRNSKDMDDHILQDKLRTICSHSK